ncbi:MAG TPA: phosphate signaling complex protein PhoU [Oligoflexia bacterium]|nr:phosphate signaling complex protein PhoU [Oligoflexia bacterium]
MHREIEKLLDRILSVADIVQLRLKQSIAAVVERDRRAAEEIIRGDAEIDQLEVDIEEECLKVLALYQPVALDLRVVIAALKMNNDIERIGDLVSNIAERAVTIADSGVDEVPLNLVLIAEKVEKMLAGSIRALMTRDVEMAREVCKEDAEIDRLHAEGYGIISEKIAKFPTNVSVYLEALSISRYLERIADIATNLAEDVIYLVEGQIVRHRQV